jgi:RNA polymerase sigma factor (TIGR02999 family)
LNHEITRILVDWDNDPQAALERLTPLVYHELRQLAASYLRRERQDHTLQPTALVNEAYMRLAGMQEFAWKDRGHFFGIAARAMRMILVDSARKNQALKRGSGKKVQLKDEVLYSPEDADEFLDLNEAIEALQKWDERKCVVLEMKYFGGMTNEQIAEAQSISVGTVRRDIAVAEAFLRRRLSEK